MPREKEDLFSEVVGNTFQDFDHGQKAEPCNHLNYGRGVTTSRVSQSSTFCHLARLLLAIQTTKMLLGQKYSYKMYLQIFCKKFHTYWRFCCNGSLDLVTVIWESKAQQRNVNKDQTNLVKLGELKPWSWRLTLNRPDGSGWSSRAADRSTNQPTHQHTKRSPRNSDWFFWGES